jgi:hypothetical protein
MKLTEKEKRELVKLITERLFKEGKVIQAGFESYRIVAMNENAPPMQIRECRMAFFAGAQHLFASINSILTEDKEPTQVDLDNMTKIFDELAAFVKEISLEKGFDSEQPGPSNASH